MGVVTVALVLARLSESGPEGGRARHRWSAGRPGAAGPSGPGRGPAALGSPSRVSRARVPRRRATLERIGKFAAADVDFLALGTGPSATEVRVVYWRVQPAYQL